jgi:hypothetical protein
MLTEGDLKSVMNLVPEILNTQGLHHFCLSVVRWTTRSLTHGTEDDARSNPEGSTPVGVKK